jgi:hypothetical protein
MDIIIKRQLADYIKRSFESFLRIVLLSLIIAFSPVVLLILDHSISSNLSSIIFTSTLPIGIMIASLGLFYFVLRCVYTFIKALTGYSIPNLKLSNTNNPNKPVKICFGIIATGVLIALSPLALFIVDHDAAITLGGFFMMATLPLGGGIAIAGVICLLICGMTKISRNNLRLAPPPLKTSHSTQNKGDDLFKQDMTAPASFEDSPLEQDHK